MDYRIERLNQVIRGWINYFRIGSMKTALQKIDEHLTDPHEDSHMETMEEGI